MNEWMNEEDRNGKIGEREKKWRDIDSNKI